MNSRILILGTGALGLLLGSRLAEGGSEIAFLGTWTDGLTAIRDVGIRCQGEPEYKPHPLPAFSSPAEAGNYSLALVLVKSWQTQRAAEQLSQVLDENGVALTLQNGLGNLEILAAALGAERAAAGLVTCGATLLGPGQVRSGGEGEIILGQDDRLDGFIEAFQSAGFRVRISADLQREVWQKLAVNTAINPLAALLEVPNGKLLDSQSARELMAQAAGETGRVADAQGIELQDPIGAAYRVAGETAGNISSMLQDFRRGNPTEIDFISGAVAEKGEQLEVPTPLNSILRLLIKARLDLSAREPQC